MSDRAAPGESQGGPIPRGVRVLFADALLLAIDKPAGMPMHPGTGHAGDSAVDWARGWLGGPRWGPAPVHRLDLETSGVAVLAVRADAAEAVGRQFQEGEVGKAYVALVQGRVHDRGSIRLPLIQRRAGDHRGPRQDRREAETRYRVLGRGQGVTLVLAEPVTGVTHQIRRHFAHIGHPIAGDARWGDRRFNTWLRTERGLGRAFLHCARLVLRHPATGRELTLKAPLPDELRAALEALGVPLPDEAALAPLSTRASPARDDGARGPGAPAPPGATEDR